MKQALIIHGAYGTPQENWFPWLKNKLQQQGYQVHVPQFPTPNNQTLENWLKVAAPHIYKQTNQSIIVGHSIGATFALSLLEIIEQPVATTCLAAGFISDLPDSSLNKINHTFYDKQFNWEKIRGRSQRFMLFHAHNDPYVPWGKAEELAGQLDTQITEIPNGGHLNTAAGYTTFPQLLESIQNIT